MNAVIWHHECHRLWAHERLCYVWLSSLPTYNPDATPYIVQNTLEHELGLYSFAIYELFGATDLLIRLWLPQSVATETVENAVRAAVGEETTVRTSQVDDVLRHWIWGDGQPPSPDLSDFGQLANGDLSPELIALIAKVDHRPMELVELDLVRQRHVATQLEPEDGIKFFVEVQAGGSHSAGRLKALESQLLAIVDLAEGVRERSLYRVTPGSAYLFSGRIAHQDLFNISSVIADPIDRSEVLQALRGRTYVYVCARPGFVHFHDRMEVGKAPLSRKEAGS